MKFFVNNLWVTERVFMKHLRNVCDQEELSLDRALHHLDEVGIFESEWCTFECYVTKSGNLSELVPLRVYDYLVAKI